ncbi:MAG: succinate dehydrogenase, partial [Candidatus Neomarinimicrobiota bacterium]
MHWFFTFMNSSLGKKIVMAVTGILLCLFLLVHLINNLVLFAGPETFNTLVGRLEAIKPLIRIMEFGMVILFLAHIGNGIRLIIENRKAGSGKYKINKAGDN